MIRTRPAYRLPKIYLSGPDGNAFALLSYARRLGREYGIDTEDICLEMMSGDYENLLRVFKKYFGKYVTIHR